MITPDITPDINVQIARQIALLRFLYLSADNKQISEIQISLQRDQLEAAGFRISFCENNFRIFWKLVFGIFSSIFSACFDSSWSMIYDTFLGSWYRCTLKTLLMILLCTGMPPSWLQRRSAIKEEKLRLSSENLQTGLCEQLHKVNCPFHSETKVVH